jgi:hypothetical protein
LLLLVLSGRFLLGLGEDAPNFRIGTLVAEAGALLFLGADNWTTVAAAWLVVELGLLIVPDDEPFGYERVARAFGWNLAAIVVWLTAGLIISNQGGSLRLAEATLPSTAALTSLLAI